MISEYKTGKEWRRTYKEKEALMKERGYEEVSPHDFYRELFPEGSLQKKGEGYTGKGNIIASQVRPTRDRSRTTKQWVVNDGLENLDKVIGDQFGLIAPISFYGKTNSKRNAHELYAIAIDVDYVGKQQLKNLLKQFGNGVQLMPTYLISSGRGVHIYYFLKEPIQLYHNLSQPLKYVKELFIRRLWNDTSSLAPDSPDISGIYQPFRCVGSQSKLGKDYPVKAFKMSENRYSIEDIAEFFAQYHKEIDVKAFREKPLREASATSLDEAKAKWPEWYERRIVKGEAKKNTKPKGWKPKNGEALYAWWKRKIYDQVKEGGRYFAIMALCAFGLKCEIPEWHIRRDAYALVEYLDSITEDEDNHFTRSDVKDALRALRNDKKELSKYSTRQWIQEHTKVDIPPNKRNYRSQEVHLKGARAIQEINDEANGTNWREGNGRKPKLDIIKEWRYNNPEGKKADCIRETGLSKPTVYKWWNHENTETAGR